MRTFVHFLTGCLLSSTVCLAAELPDIPKDVDIVIIGEFHDNPAHHAIQRDVVATLSPTAVVYEMLLPQEADVLKDVGGSFSENPGLLDEFHWSNIADYVPLLDISKVIIGAALPRDQVRDAFSTSAAAVFGEKATLYGLDEGLPQIEQTTREALQFEAHCQAMPRDMMSGMVEAQRLRDAHFTQVLLESLDTYGAPIVFVTGNGHARKDWGVPAYVQRVRPDVYVFSVGQSEDAALVGGFDVIVSAPAPLRDDPCAAFQ